MVLLKKYGVSALILFWILIVGYGCAVYWQERNLNTMQDKILLNELKRTNQWLVETSSFRATWVKMIQDVQATEDKQNKLLQELTDVKKDTLKHQEEILNKLEQVEKTVIEIQNKGLQVQKEIEDRQKLFAENWKNLFKELDLYKRLDKDN